MVGIIRRREQVKAESSFNPDDMFDENHIATEANFIQLLEHGVYDSKYIGYKLQLSNSVNYNNGLWIIADVNHDSTNTGQTGCYDLISQDCFYSTKFGSSQNWRSSTPRTYLNGTFYNGFSSAFKAHMICPKYKSQSTWYTDDYVILPSYKEVNGGTSSYQDIEGVAYPIFTDNSSRVKYSFGTTNIYSWWTRSRRTNDSFDVWRVSTGGSLGSNVYYGSLCVVPLMRVS